MWNLYEDPWLLLIVGVVALIVGVWIRNNVAEKQGLWLILAGVLIAAGGFGLDYAVATDYEQIQTVIYTCRDAAITKDIRPIAPLISPSYQDSIHFNREIFIESIESVFKTAAISKVKFQEMTINLFGRTGRAAIKTVVFLDPNTLLSNHNSNKFNWLCNPSVLILQSVSISTCKIETFSKSVTLKICRIV
jgi:hypothetical protein